jgi:hypothetical protein
MADKQSRCPDNSATKWSVNHWGSHPDADNDDCFTGDDFDSLELAKASALYQGGTFDVAFIELDGPGIYEVRPNPNYSAKACKFEDSLERSERAMQAGMAFGCQGYNEEMGWE